MYTQRHTENYLKSREEQKNVKTKSKSKSINPTTNNKYAQKYFAEFAKIAMQSTILEIVFRNYVLK